MVKTPEEVKLWRTQQKADGTSAMAEYKDAEGRARGRLAKLRTERLAREATGKSEEKVSPQPAVRKAKPRS
jgi:hypothetical protein